MHIVHKKGKTLVSELRLVRDKSIQKSDFRGLRV